MRSHYSESSTVELIVEVCLLWYMDKKVAVAGGGRGIRKTYQTHVEHHVKVGC